MSDQILVSNPINVVLEERSAALERGVDTIAVSSRQAPLHLATATVTEAGGHIVASPSTRCCSVWRERRSKVWLVAHVHFWISK
ncbi:MAG TPA: PLP-dependent transferase [Rhodocyclaceae bacterium]|nr:PLP-dependent transferase [Rhodocyclaceae bacterium]